MNGRAIPSSLARTRANGVALLDIIDLVAEEVAVRVAELVGPDLAHPEPAEPWRLFTLEEAAARLTRSTRWVRERVKRGEMPYVRLDGGAFAFTPEDVRAFALERRIGGDPLAGRLQATARDALFAGVSGERTARHLTTYPKVERRRTG